MENLQCTILRTILKTQWYLRNDDLKKTIPTVEQKIIKYFEAHHRRIKNYINQFTVNYYSNFPRRKENIHQIYLHTQPNSISTHVSSN